MSDRPLALVTGPTAGIGRVTAHALARAGYDVLLACRAPEPAVDLLASVQAAAPEGTPVLLPLDLGSLASVRTCAQQVIDRPGHLRLLINNAGLAGRKAGLTQDGFEETLGVNHLGHYLLTRLLEGRLLEAGGARVVHVSSRAHLRTQAVDWDNIRRPRNSVTGLDKYAQSKLANVLFSQALAHRHDAGRLASFSLHPGVVATELWRRVPQPFRALGSIFMKSPEEGAKTTIFAALDPSLQGRTGLYLRDCAEAPMNPVANDEDNQRACWLRSAELVGLPA